MKNFKLFLLPLFLLVASMTFVSCNNDTSESTLVGYEYATAWKDASGNYVFYTDNNNVIRLNAMSSKQVNDAFKGKVERAFLYYQYNTSEVVQSNNVVTVNNAVAVQGTQRISVDALETTASATEKNLLVADSAFAVSSVDILYAYKGYLNIGVVSQYSVVNSKGVYPTLTAVVDESDVSENAITVHLYCNRHSPKNAQVGGSVGVTHSFRINNLDTHIPGNEDVTLTLKVEGYDNKMLTKQCKIARKQFAPYDFIN